MITKLTKKNINFKLIKGFLKSKMLSCQAQLELTLMMCLSDRFTLTGTLSDRSTFTSTDARTMDFRHYFFGGLVVV